MNKKIKHIIIIIGILGIIFLICFFFISKWADSKIENENISELGGFDFRVDSYLDLMPGTSLYKKSKAFFIFSLEGIDNDTFFNQYKIISIKLNGKTIKNNQLIVENNNKECFRFYSKFYEDNNSIRIIIKDKNTDLKYFKELEVSTIEVQ